MLTLADIDAKFPETHDGSVFSDLYKDCYGFRPRGAVFDSIEDFQKEFNRLAEDVLPVKMDEEDQCQQRCFEAFKNQVADIRDTVLNTSLVDAVRIIVDAEDCKEDVEWYGYEALEYRLGLKFGSIKKFLES